MSDKSTQPIAMTPTVLKALAEIATTLTEATADIDQANYGLAKGKINTSRSRLAKALEYFGYKPPAKGK